MKQKSHLTKSGYEITVQIFNDNLNHIYINDRNLYQILIQDQKILGEPMVY